MRIWRAYGIGQGKLIPYQDLIVKPQGPTGLVVNEIFLLLKAAWFYKSTINSDGEKSNDLFACSEPGYNMVFKKCSELESHLNIGEHCHIRRNFDKAYDRLKRDWAEKFLSVDREDSGSAPLDLVVKNSTNAEIGDWRLQEGDRQAKKLRRGKVLTKSAFMNWSLAFSCPSDSLIVFTVRSS